jgi:uncharacterized membrane protein YfcA
MIKKRMNMDIQTILIIILVGIAAGMLSGLVGVGGGTIIVPALIFFLGFSQHSAQGTSLGVLLLPAGILAVMQYYKAGDVDIKAVIMLAAGFVVGGYYGSRLALSLPQETVKKIFAIFLLLIALKMLFFNNKKIEEKVSTPQIENTNS